MSLGLDMSVMTLAFGLAYYFGRNEEVSLLFKYMFILGVMLTLFQFGVEYSQPAYVQVLFYLSVIVFFVFLLMDILKLTFIGVKAIAANFKLRFKI